MNLLIRLILFLIVLPLLFPANLSGQNKAPLHTESKLRWFNVEGLGVEGKGWTETKHFYDRLPAKAETIVRPPVWNLNKNSAGLSVRFLSNASEIYVRWSLRSPNLAMWHMPSTGVSGVDLYVKNQSIWRWLGIGRPEKPSANEQKIIGNLTAEKREYLLYLPLYNGVEAVEIGVSEKSVLEKAPSNSIENSKPIVFYGTSIVQGAVASRPGMAYPSILSRRLNKPAINLGFSGNGMMEPEVAVLLSEIEAEVFVIDCLPNLSKAEEVEARTPKLIEIIRKKRPDTPIILVENLIYPDALFEEVKRGKYQEKNAALKRTFQNLIKSGVKRLYYVSADNLIGADGEATVDGVHPTDLGFIRIADALEPVLKKAIKSR
jgi:lysophospholipase L1-like esterase